MSIQGIVVIDLLGIGLMFLILHLVRTGRLYPGYAAMWIAALLVLLILVSLPPLLTFVTRALGAVFPVSALTLLAFFFTFLVLVLFSVKLTALSEKQTELVQELALRDLARREGSRPSESASVPEREPSAEEGHS